MGKENYAAWDLDPSAFDAQPPDARRAFLVRFAVLAPSGHNSQPWTFTMDGDAIIVAPDMSRALPHSDANDRQLYLSLGCAIENLAAAADYYGYRAEVSRTDVEDHAAWSIRLTGGPMPAAARHADHRALAVPRRRTNRNKYEGRLPDAGFMEWMRGLSDDRMRLHLVKDEPVKSQIAGVVSDALIEAMDDDGFRLELSGYIRSNITREETGMAMFGFGMPTPPSLIAPWLVKNFNVNRPSRKQDLALLEKHTPVFGILTTRSDGPEAWVEAGRAYERIALEAERRGIATAPMAAAIQIGTHFQRLQKLLGTDLRPQMFFRIGYAKKVPPHSPRLQAVKVMKL